MVKKTKREGKQREHVSAQSLLASIIAMFNPRGRIGNPVHGARIFTHTFYTHKLPAKTYSPVSDSNQTQNKKRQKQTQLPTENITWSLLSHTVDSFE